MKKREKLKGKKGGFLGRNTRSSGLNTERILEDHLRKQPFDSENH